MAVAVACENFLLHACTSLTLETQHDSMVTDASPLFVYIILWLGRGLQSAPVTVER